MSVPLWFERVERAYGGIVCSCLSFYFFLWFFPEGTLTVGPGRKDIAKLVTWDTFAAHSLRRREAYEVKGLPLEYYASWDANWHRPGEFFDTVPLVNKSLMMSCKSGFPSGQMQLYLAETGDTGGVNVNASTGAHSAVCVDDAFWIAPACRSNHSQCVVLITGGTGWGVSEMMQKATAHNMPFAIGVAGTWGTYTQLPITKRDVQQDGRTSWRLRGSGLGRPVGVSGPRARFQCVGGLRRIVRGS